jgi:hypothetical protein
VKSLTEDEIERINDVLKAQEMLPKEEKEKESTEETKDVELEQVQLEQVQVLNPVYSTKDEKEKEKEPKPEADTVSKVSRFSKNSLLSSLQSQLAEEKQARLKLEAELQSLKKFTMEM